MNGLAYERRGGVALCIIDRPEDQNRLTKEVLRQLTETVERLSGANSAAVAVGRASLAAMAGMTAEQAVTYSRSQMVTLMSCGH